LPAKNDEAQRIATALHNDWDVQWIAPDHCTGEPAFEVLKQTFSDRYLYAGLGSEISFEASLVTSTNEHNYHRAHEINQSDSIEALNISRHEH